MYTGLMDKLRKFFGLEQQPPRNDFRNPIWGTDDDDEGDELYSRQHFDFQSPLDFHREVTRHMQDIFKSFGGLFGDMKLFVPDDHIDGFVHTDAFTNTPNSSTSEMEVFDSNRIRDYYLKPGYLRPKRSDPRDADLDGKISSHEISGLLKKNDDGGNLPFDGKLVQGVPFCQTIITTSVKKSDGSMETRRIVKRGNEIIEETTTSTEPDSHSPGLNSISTQDTTGVFLSDLASLFRNFY